MNTPIQKPIKRLTEELLKDSEHLSALLAISFLPDGQVRAHGAGLISTEPALALYGTARLLVSLISNYSLEKDTSLTVNFKEGQLQITGEGLAAEDPRATVALLAMTLVELAGLINQMDNLVEEKPASTNP
jgi:hypothetical protein